MSRQPTLNTNLFGTKVWRLNDILHREDGPAVIYCTGIEEWYFYGKRHRKDGPAITESILGATNDLFEGNAYRWFLYGQEYTYTEWKLKASCCFFASFINTSKIKSKSIVVIL